MSDSRRFLAFGLAALLLLGCGGGATPDRQFGVAENQLFDPLRRLEGAVVGTNSGLVTLQLEPPAGPPAPQPGDSAVVGVDELWFDVDKAGTATPATGAASATATAATPATTPPSTATLVLTEQNLAQVSRMEVNVDVTGKSLLWADATQRQSSLSLLPGRYMLRLVAAPGATETTMVFVWFGGISPRLNPDDLKRLATGTCVACLLAGADLSEYNLRGSNLTRSDLSGAMLAPFPGGLKLAPTELFKIFISAAGVGGFGAGVADLSAANLSAVKMTDTYLDHAMLGAANLAGADLSRSVLKKALLGAANLAGATLRNVDFRGADLSGANLTGAILTDADLSGANLSAANLVAADFSGAKLDGAIWSSTKICAAGSTGVCR